MKKTRAPKCGVENTPPHLGWKNKHWSEGGLSMFGAENEGGEKCGMRLGGKLGRGEIDLLGPAVARHGGPKGNTIAYSQQCMHSIQWKCYRMQFVCADFRRRMQFRRHGVAPITPSWKSVPRNFSTGNVFSRGGSDMVSILEPLRLVHRMHSSTKQHSKVVPSRPVLPCTRTG